MHGCHSRVGRQGRLVIPAEVRAALGLQPGDVLHLQVEDRRIMFERPADASRQLRSLGRVPDGRSLVDELLAERRAEAASQ